MSFLKPTAASKSRERAVREQQRVPPAPSSEPSVAVPNFAQPLAQQLFRDGKSTTTATSAAPLPDYSHVRSRVDSGLHEPRTQQAWHVTSRKRSHSPATDLAHYTNRCNDVVQRAQQLLERTRRQEELVAHALQQRLSQSPARRAPSWSSATSPIALRAPPVTPVSDHDAPTHPSHPSVRDEAAADRSTTPSRREDSAAPLACPPPTPATVGGRSPAPLPPPLPGTDEMMGSPDKPSFFQRLRHSLQRLSGQLPPDVSPMPLPPSQASSPTRPAAPSTARQSLSHARKSVHFVSPDKLEHVTPTKLQPISGDDVEDSTSEEEEAEEAEEVAARVPHARSRSLPPLPAPPPSAVKAARAASRSDAGPLPPASAASPSPVPTGRSRTASATTSPRRSDAVPRVTASSPRAASAASSARSSPATSPSKAKAAEKTKKAAKTKAAKTKAAKKAPAADAKSAKGGKKPLTTPVKVTFKVPEGQSEADDDNPRPSRGKGTKKASSTSPTSRARGGARASSASSSRSTSAASTPEQAAKLTKANRAQHEEMLAFILSNPIKRCVNNFTKEQLVTFLHGEGVPDVKELDMTKRQLLDEIRALLGKKN